MLFLKKNIKNGFIIPVLDLAKSAMENGEEDEVDDGEGAVGESEDMWASSNFIG